MKNLLKQLAYTIATIFFMISPAMAGQVELQTEVPIYEVKEGQELTEEEQRLLHATLDYFVENPEIESITINSYDFPSISNGNYQFIYNLIGKIDTFISHYPISCDGGNYYKQEYLILPGTISYNKNYTEIEVLNYYSVKRNFGFNSISCTPKEIYDWANYTYSLVPQLGITDGMDEVQALDIINNFTCDLMIYDNSNKDFYNYINIYEYKKGVCSDYAVLFNTLAKAAGIESYYIAGVDGIHAWNEVVVNGQSLEIDSCWNDELNRHDYYLLTRNQMAVNQYHETAERLF